jgi:hypothetical protein
MIKSRSIASIKLLMEHTLDKFFVPEYQATDSRAIQIYWHEVESDIKFIRAWFSMPRFERERADCFQQTINPYIEKYCPCTFYKHFSMENQIKYLLYRSIINDLIMRNETQEYSDDISIKPENN